MNPKSSVGGMCLLIVTLVLGSWGISAGLSEPPRDDSKGENPAPAASGEVLKLLPVVSLEEDKKSDPQRPENSTGQVPLIDLLRFLQSSTGKIVLFPSVHLDQNFDDSIFIPVLGSIDPFTPEIVSTILEANGYRFLDDQLSDGTQFLHITHVQSRNNFMRVPEITDIFRPGMILEDHKGGYGTAVIELKHVEPKVLVSILRDLFVASKHLNTFLVYRDRHAKAVIIKCKLTSLRYIEKLVAALESLSGPSTGPLFTPKKSRKKVL